MIIPWSQRAPKSRECIENEHLRETSSDFPLIEKGDENLERTMSIYSICRMRLHLDLCTPGQEDIVADWVGISQLTFNATLSNSKPCSLR